MEKYVYLCVCGAYLGPHWQGRVEGLHSFVELSTEVVKDPKARLQIRVDAVRVVQNCFQEELLDLRLQGAENMHGWGLVWFKAAE